MDFLTIARSPNLLLAMQALYHILANAQRHKKSIIKEACWTISNITAGTKEQISAVIESCCIEPIVHLLKHGELEIKREAAWAISNATSGGDISQIQQLVQYGCIPPLCELLRVMDHRVVQVRTLVAMNEQIKRCLCRVYLLHIMHLHVARASALDQSTTVATASVVALECLRRHPAETALARMNLSTRPCPCERAWLQLLRPCILFALYTSGNFTDIVLGTKNAKYHDWTIQFHRHRFV